MLVHLPSQLNEREINQSLYTLIQQPNMCCIVINVDQNMTIIKLCKSKSLINDKGNINDLEKGFWGPKNTDSGILGGPSHFNYIV